MEINKQLFEDVLSGKLKGTFVFRNGTKVSSDALKSQTQEYFYELRGDGYLYTYYSDGRYSCFSETWLDIVDFIPEMNMKENELTIAIPDNKVVDWDESKKQNKIVLKDKQLTYKDVCKNLFKNNVYYTDVYGKMRMMSSGISDECITNPNNASTEHQLECIFAKNQLATVAKYLNDGWKPDKNIFGQFNAWVLYVNPDKDYIGCIQTVDCAHNINVLFKSKELAQQAIEILGEKIVKLALEPLGI